VTSLETASQDAAAAVDPVGIPDGRSYWRAGVDRLLANRFGATFGVILLAMILVSAAAPLVSAVVTQRSPVAQDLTNIFAGIEPGHLLGTDELGRDTLTRLVWGGRGSLFVGVLTVALYILLGGGVGLICGFHGGAVDSILMRFVDVLMSTPTIYLLILVSASLPLAIGPFVFQQDAVSLSVTIAIVSWGPVARLVRGEVLSIKERDYVLAARALGGGTRDIIFRHTLPSILPLIIVIAGIGVGQVMLVAAALDYIGLGVQPPTPTWGNMLLNAQTYFSHSALLVILPGAAIMLAVLSANIFGNAVRDAFDPRLGAD
jgi:peptide/nickel transport system permease protein